MTCPRCGCQDTKVTHTMSGRNQYIVYRRRKCGSCGCTWRTWERSDPTDPCPGHLPGTPARGPGMGRPPGRYTKRFPKDFSVEIPPPGSAPPPRPMEVDGPPADWKERFVAEIRGALGAEQSEEPER